MTDTILQLLTKMDNSPGESGWYYIYNLNLSEGEGIKMLKFCTINDLIKPDMGGNGLNDYYTITILGKILKQCLKNLTQFEHLGKFKFH